MTAHLEQLTKRIHELEEALHAEIEEKRREFRYRLERRRIVFDADVRARHHAARERLSSFLARARLSVVLTSPVIYGLIVPLAILDLCVGLYQAVCFPIYGIPKVRRGDYIVIDRQHLAYLNGLQKLNCVYCGYANGLIAWVREIASRTEAHWCPIKHAQAVADPHRRYSSFVDFGDETALRERTEMLRTALRDDVGSR